MPDLERIIAGIAPQPSFGLSPNTFAAILCTELLN